MSSAMVFSVVARNVDWPTFLIVLGCFVLILYVAVKIVQMLMSPRSQKKESNHPYYQPTLQVPEGYQQGAPPPYVQQLRSAPQYSLPSSADPPLQGARLSFPPGTILYSLPSFGVFTAAWSPDGTRIASGSDDKTVQLWDAADGGNVYSYHRHPDAVRAVAWSPDGTRIASASVELTVQVWQAS